MASSHLPSTKLDDAQAEEQLEDALEHIKELHLKLRLLRSTLPRMLKPIFTKYPSPTVMYKSFLASIQTTKHEIDDFRQFITSDDTKKIFAQVSESRRRNPKGIIPWSICDDPGWTTLKRKRKARDDDTNNTTGAAPSKRPKLEESG